MSAATSTSASLQHPPADGPAAAPARAALVAGPRLTATLLVLGALGEVVEQLVSPLPGGDRTTDDLIAIAAHPAAYATSVAVGLLSTFFLLLGFLGLLEACRPRSPRWSRAGAWVTVVSLSCFVGIRAVQVVELQLARSGLPTVQAGALFDAAFSTPLGLVVVLLFTGGTFVGLVAICVACWRAGLPRAAALLLAAFPLVDQVLHGQAASVAAHVLLLVALAWLGVALWRGVGASRD